jgi:FkbM family methyltransferase
MEATHWRVWFQPRAVRDRITCLNVGAAEFAGSVNVPVNREPKPGHRVDHGASGGGMVPVRLIPLDEIPREQALRPGLVKLDVEGLEVQVMRGAQALLRDIRPVWMIEVHPPEIESFGDKVPELLEALRDSGYELPRCTAIAPKRSPDWYQ